MLNKSTRVKKTIINRRDGNGKKNILTALGFLSPTLVIFCAFVLFPVFFSFYLSFHKWNMFSSGREFLGLENYRRLFSDPEFWMVLKNTFIYTLGTVPLNMVIALLTAIILNRRIAGKRFLRTAIFTPVVISPVAAALIWRWIYDPNFGLLNYLMDLVGLPSVNWLNEPKAAMVALIIMGVWKTFGTNMVLFSAGLQGIPVVGGNCLV